MRQMKSNGMTTAHLSSMTVALKAQRALAAAAIRAEIVKSDSTANHGCSYGIVFSSAQLANVRTILSAAHVHVRRYENDGGDQL